MPRTSAGAPATNAGSGIVPTLAVDLLVGSENVVTRLCKAWLSKVSLSSLWRVVLRVRPRSSRHGAPPRSDTPWTNACSVPASAYGRLRGGTREHRMKQPTISPVRVHQPQRGTRTHHWSAEPIAALSMRLV